MKVAYILPTLRNPSGWRRHTLSFLQHIRAHVDPVLFVSGQDLKVARFYFPEMQAYSLPVTQDSPPGSPRAWLRWLSCWQALRIRKFPQVDLVHSLEAYPAGLVGYWLAARLKRPHVLTVHGTYGVVWVQSRIDRVLYSQVLRQAAHICPVSQGTADQVRRYFSSVIGHTPLTPILNGNDFYMRILRVDALQRTPSPVPLILSVGEVKPRKGYHLSLQAFARVQREIPAVRYVIVGSKRPGPYLDRLMKIIDSDNLSGVELRGAVSPEELDDLFRQAWLFLLTPEQQGFHFEGFGLVYLEAGAYGLPVIGTHTGGVPDAVRHDETGLLVEPGDIDGISRAIRDLINDQALSQRLGQNNREWSEKLTWERNAREYADVYQQVLRRRNLSAS